MVVVPNAVDLEVSNVVLNVVVVAKEVVLLVSVDLLVETVVSVDLLVLNAVV